MYHIKLIALENERELLQEVYSTQYNSALEKVNKIITKWFLDPFNAVCIRKSLNHDYINENSITVSFELGFLNSNNLIDFGSELNIKYNTFSKKLMINHGVCGWYSLEDEYQVARAKTIAHIWNNIEEIQEDFDACGNEFIQQLSDLDYKIMNLHLGIRDTKKYIQQKETESIMNSIKVGTKLYYTEDCELLKSYRLFYGECTIIKQTPKFVLLKNDYDQEYKVKKDLLVDQIQNKFINIEDQE